jgi:hypothetical protein
MIVIIRLPEIRAFYAPSYWGGAIFKKPSKIRPNRLQISQNTVRTPSSKGHKRLSNEVGGAFFIVSVESLLSKANKGKRPPTPKAWERLWVRPACCDV